MKVICSKDELIKGMQIVQPLIASKTTLPVLSNFLFETEEKGVGARAEGIYDSDYGAKGGRRSANQRYFAGRGNA